MPEVVMVSRMLLWHSRKNSTGTAMMMNVTAAAAPARDTPEPIRLGRPCKTSLVQAVVVEPGIPRL